MAQELQAAGKMVSQLDVLLMKAAKISTQSLGGKQIKSTLQKLVDDGALSEDSLKLLAKTADTAAETLKALDKFSGRQLAEAFNKKGAFDASTKVGNVIAHAEKLKDEGRIVQGDAWQNVRERPLQTGNVTVQNRDGQGKSIGGSVAKIINQLYCPSYFARDDLSKILE